MITIDIISGFLGSGKTTFIKQLLESQLFKDEKVVLIENEYGKINFDSMTLKNSNIPLYEITKGCLCCSLQKDFVTSLNSIAEDLSPDRIIVEPSGIFMLETFFDMMKDSGLREKFNIGSILTLVDGTMFDGGFLPMTQMIGNQIKFADQVLISKYDLMDEEMYSRCLQFIGEWNNQASIALRKAEMSMDELASCFKEKRHQCFEISGEFEPTHHQSLTSETIDMPKSLKKEAVDCFFAALRRKEAGDIIRMKGYMDIEGVKYECQYTNGILNLIPIASDPPCSLVIIGTNLRLRKIENLLKSRKWTHGSSFRKENIRYKTRISGG